MCGCHGAVVGRSQDDGGDIAVTADDDVLVDLDGLGIGAGADQDLVAILGRSDGLTRLLLDPRDGRVLGAGLAGPGAGELIAEIALAIEMGAVAEDLSLTVHPHPTLSETLMNAGEVHFGTATEIFKPKRKPASVG